MLFPTSFFCPDPVAGPDLPFLTAFYPGIDLLAYNRLQENWLGEQPTSQELVALLGEEAAELRKVAHAIFDFLWPDAATPETIAQLATKVAEVPTAIDRLRDLAAQAGAEMALELMLSWYKDTRVEKIPRRRRPCCHPPGSPRTPRLRHQDRRLR